MDERLVWFKAPPAQITQWWPHRGGGDAGLRQRYPQAHHRHVMPAIGRLAASAHAVSASETPWWKAALRWASKRGRVAPTHLAFDDEEAPNQGLASLLWANMVLHHVADAPALLRQWHAATHVEGLLMFSTLGPDTLREIREIYQSQRWGVPGPRFIDMHDVGDELMRAGFADPVMDQERITLHWADPQALLNELRGLGRNHATARFEGLRTPRWREALESALRNRADAQGRLSMTFEVVYGHAFKPAPKSAPMAARETRISVDALRATVPR